jgi:transposase
LGDAHGIEPIGYIQDLLWLLPSWPRHRTLDLALLNWATTAATEEVAVKLAANRLRQAVLASRA